MSRRDEKRIHAKNRTGGIIIFVVIAIVIFFCVFFFYLDSKNVEYDKKTLCPVNGPSAYTAILLDRTDSISSVQSIFIRKYINKYKENLKIAEKLSIFSINNVDKDIYPLLSICNPDDGSKSNPLYENPKKLKKKWEEKFSDKVDKVLTDAISPGKKEHSPIMEMIQAVLVSAYPLSSEKQPKKLLVISDMLHHTKEYSHYTDSMDYSHFRSSPYYKRVLTNLQDVEITILYVGRSNVSEIQDNRHIDFWIQYITKMGGTVAQIERVPG